MGRPTKRSSSKILLLISLMAACQQCEAVWFWGSSTENAVATTENNTSEAQLQVPVVEADVQPEPSNTESKLDVATMTESTPPTDVEGTPSLVNTVQSETVTEVEEKEVVDEVKPIQEETPKDVTTTPPQDQENQGGWRIWNWFGSSSSAPAGESQSQQPSGTESSAPATNEQNLTAPLLSTTVSSPTAPSSVVTSTSVSQCSAPTTTGENQSTTVSSPAAPSSVVGSTDDSQAPAQPIPSGNGSIWSWWNPFGGSSVTTSPETNPISVPEQPTQVVDENPEVERSTIFDANTESKMEETVIEGKEEEKEGSSSASSSEQVRRDSSLNQLSPKEVKMASVSSDSIFDEPSMSVFMRNLFKTVSEESESSESSESVSAETDSVHSADATISSPDPDFEAESPIANLEKSTSTEDDSNTEDSHSTSDEVYDTTDDSEGTSSDNYSASSGSSSSRSSRSSSDSSSDSSDSY